MARPDLTGFNPQKFAAAARDAKADPWVRKCVKPPSPPYYRDTNHPTVRHGVTPALSPATTASRAPSPASASRLSHSLVILHTSSFSWPRSTATVTDMARSTTKRMKKRATLVERYPFICTVHGARRYEVRDSPATPGAMERIKYGATCAERPNTLQWKDSEGKPAAYGPLTRVQSEPIGRQDLLGVQGALCGSEHVWN